MNAWWVKYLPEILKECLHGRQQLQKTVGNTGWLLFDRILRMGVGVVVSAWVARYLGPAQFGVLAYVISFLAFFQVIANLSIDGFIVRDIAQKPEETTVILGTALWLRLFFGIFSWGLAVLLMYFFHPADLQLIMLTAIIGATLLFQASDTVDLWFQSQTQSRRTVVAKLAAYMFSVCVKVTLLLIKAPLTAFAGVICLEYAACALGLALAYRRFPTHERWKACIHQAKAMLKLSWPFLASTVMMTTFARIDQIILKEMLGAHALGLYAAALPISTAWTMIPSTLVTSIAPYVAQKMKQDERLYHEILVKIFRMFAILAFVGATLTAIMSPLIIRLLYGPQYQPSALLLATHVFVNLFLFQGTAQYLWVINNNVRTVTLIGTALSAMVCVLSNLVLIKEFGLIGAPVSTLVTEFFSVVLIPCLLRRDLLYLYIRAFAPFMNYRFP